MMSQAAGSRTQIADRGEAYDESNLSFLGVQYEHAKLSPYS